MIDFLNIADYLVFVTEGVLHKIIRNDNSRLSDSERMAYGYIYEKLSGMYNLDIEIQKKGDSRNPALVRWMSVLAIYYIYQSIPDDEIPERVRINYEDVVEEIQRVASGKDSSTLSPVRTESGQPRTRSKFYYSRRREQNPYC